jgi:HprK-related kinase A
MNIAALPPGEIVRRMAGAGLRYRIGPFRVQLQTRIRPVVRLFELMYGECAVDDEDSIAEFHVSLVQPRGLRRWFRRQVLFCADLRAPFAPFPLESAFPLLEWGLNWCSATRAHRYLMLHAAVVERDGVALVLPAWPGAGKSTLCAALSHRGWRLFSDEFGLVTLGANEFVPFPRCIPLKNESIEVFRSFAPEAVIGPVFPKTRKGDVAHVKPPASSIEAAGDRAPSAFVVYPRFDPGEKTTLTPMAKSRAFMKLCGNSFNYEILGAAGFETVANIIRESDCYFLRYADLDDAVTTIGRLTGSRS